MSEQEGAGTESGGLIVGVGGSMAALRELAEPPRLSPSELDIVSWYALLVQRLSGPKMGDDRGPAKEPPWMKQGPQIEVVEVLDEDPPIIIVGGRGLGAATAVWIDGSPAPWQAADDDVLRIALRESPTETLILIRTPEGDVAGRLTPNG
jgi:hypothetical protein